MVHIAMDYDHRAWVHGAALSQYLHIIHIVVDLLTLMYIVVLSLLMLIILLLIQVGALALLYHASYYIFRGGSSVNGDLCGILFLYTGNIASNAGWNIGAALSFI